MKPLEPIPDTARITPEHYLAIRSDGLTFMQCANAAIGEIDLVRQVDRLYGTDLAKSRAPIEQMIDKACGKQDADMQTFLRFVWNCILVSLPKLPCK